MIGVLILVVAFGGWYLFGGSGGNDALVSTEVVTSASDSELVSTLIQLRAVTLSGTIFSDPVFMSLKDFGVQILPEPVGRPNPFAPLGQTTPTPTTGAPGGTSVNPNAQIFAPGR